MPSSAPSSSSSATLEPYPALYRFIFGLVEPGGLLLGGLFALLGPQSFYNAYLGAGWLGDVARQPRVDPKGIMVASGMGSCMLIIGVMSSVMLPSMAKLLKNQPEMHEQMLRRYLGCLLVGDFIHAFATLYYAPTHVRWHPFSRWTLLIWGNVLGTLTPNIARLFWFAKIGRTPNSVALR